MRSCEQLLQPCLQTHHMPRQIPSSCAGSSEALLSGQRPPFALAVAVVDVESGKRREDIPMAVSDCFVVSSPPGRRVHACSYKHAVLLPGIHASS